MLQFERFVLNNGLVVLVHEDHATPVSVINVMYNVGARDENPNKTGFAHLFEHLMFGGSVHIPDYDEPLQLAGGENNAYTTNDITNYYLRVPAENVETGFWLESDRMLGLAFNEKSLEVQRKVVCEEFKEHYINKPYGDVWKHMRSLAYTTHPYQWMTIGKELSHVEEATMDDVKQFFNKHYSPSNAVLVVAGKVKTNEIIKLAQKWFEPIPSGIKYNRNLPQEPKQTQSRFVEVKANVPLDMLVKTWHMDSRLEKGYYVADMLTEILGNGESSRLYQQLVKNKKMFSSLACYQFGSVEPGLFAFEGKLVKGVSIVEAEKALHEVLDELMQHGISDRELQKIKNKTESAITFEDTNVMNRAGNLAFYEILQDAALMNTELDRYMTVTTQDMLEKSQSLFDNNNCNTLYYLSAQ